MDSLIFELPIIFYFQLFLSANVRHTFYRNQEMNKSFIFQIFLKKQLASVKLYLVYSYYHFE